MKTVVAFFGLVAIVLAEKEAPYPPSGWKPDGPSFTYPPPTPSREYGPASTPAPTEPPTQAPQEPASTYIPAEEGSQPSNGGYSRYQSQKLTQSAAQVSQGHGQFFIITPQGQLQHIPIAFPQPTNRDAETIETQDERTSAGDRLVQRPSKNQSGEQRQKTESRQRGQTSANLASGRPDRRFERVQKQETSAKDTLKTPGQEQTRFVAFIPAVPLSTVQEAAMLQATNQQNGQYQLIYPNGRLQTNQHRNVLGVDNRLSANVQYQEVDSIRGPLYTFGAPLVRVI